MSLVISDPLNCCTPAEVDVGIVAVLRPLRASSRKGAEESVGQQTGDLLLRQREGSTALRDQERDGLNTETQTQPIRETSSALTAGNTQTETWRTGWETVFSQWSHYRDQTEV